MPEAGREEALAMAAQVFGEPVAAQSYSSDVTGSEGPLSAEPAPEPQTPRVLPDLLAIARERSETEEAEKRRITRRSRSKREGQEPQPVSLQTALQFDEPDQPDHTAPERPAERVVGAALRASADPEPKTELSWPEIASTPIHLPFATADLRSRNGKAKKWILPRSERWKERRLPRACWDKPTR
jgi:hypothetical protein